MRLVVLDTMVFLQGLANPGGPSGEVMKGAFAGEYAVVMSSDTLDELRDLLHRPKLRKGFLKVTDEQADAFFDAVSRLVRRIDPVPKAFEYARDPKDEKYLNLAIAAGAKLIVSRDNDLLDLMTSEDDEARSFRTTYPDIAVLDPVAFLARIRSSTTDPN